MDCNSVGSELFVFPLFPVCSSMIEPISAVGVSSSSMSQLARISSEKTSKLQQTIRRISGGTRLTSPAVDAAGMAQSMHLESAITRIDAAQSNIANAVSFSEAQFGALQAMAQAVNRMGQLSIRAQDETLNVGDRSNLQAEFSRLQAFVSDSTETKFNGVDLFSMNVAQAHDIHVTIEADAGTPEASGLQDFVSAGTDTNFNGVDLFALNVAQPSDIHVTIDADAHVAKLERPDVAAASKLGNVLDGLSVETPTQAKLASETLATAVQNVATIRANVAASTQNLDVSGESLSVLKINLNAANGQIVGGPFPREAVELAGEKIMADSALMAFTKAYRFPRPGLSMLA